MRLIITGASGNLGRALVPALSQMGVSLILVGREIDILREIFPKYKVADYKNLKKLSKQYDSILHLSILNNDKKENFDLYYDVNVVFLRKILSTITGGKIKYFIYPASIHSLDESRTDFYSKSKYKAEEIVSNFDDVPVRILRLPAVYGERFSGRLALLNNCPSFVRLFLFDILRCFRPTVSANKVAAALLALDKYEGEILLTDNQSGNRIYSLIARSVDLFFALSVILLMWWLIAICIVGVKVSSSGPGIFAQTRVGKNGKNFVCYKLRTMKSGTAERATHEISNNQITKFGYVLRKSKLDELPQVVNILKGEMSLVGPRPCLPAQRELIQERNKRGVLSHKPGITGWAQVNRIDMSDPVRLAEADEFFIKMRTLPMLGKILWSTLLGKF